jgi:glutathionyl-hydroquinone reductase
MAQLGQEWYGEFILPCFRDTPISIRLAGFVRSWLTPILFLLISSRADPRTDPNADFPAAAGRYHLYVAYACPWAHRTLMVRALKGLEEAISVTIVHPIWQKTKPMVDNHGGWIFGSDDDGNDTIMLKNMDGNGGPFPRRYPGNTPDPFANTSMSRTTTTSIRDVYERVHDKDGKYTVPILYDTVRHTIVSNESSEIIRMLNAEFNDYARFPALDLYPAPLRTQIDAVNDWVYPTLNNGVYRCGFAQSQMAYDAAIAELTAAFDKVDDTLQKQRFLVGDAFTEADVRLFVTLVRFDEVYVVYFKTNTRSVQHTDSILNYCREIYQMPGVKDTVNMEQIKAHYYCSHPILNHYSIIPRGTDFCHLLDQPHNRGALFSS